jgi:hypothetical protein
MVISHYVQKIDRGVQLNMKRPLWRVSDRLNRSDNESIYVENGQKETLVVSKNSDYFLRLDKQKPHHKDRAITEFAFVTSLFCVY